MGIVCLANLQGFVFHVLLLIISTRQTQLVIVIPALMEIVSVANLQELV